MKTYRINLVPRTAFGSPLLGETLFGSLCWAVVRLSGENRLKNLLEGYDEGRPFAVVSDAFPAGFVPLPAMPTSFWTPAVAADRKKLKKQIWLAHDDLERAPREWRNLAKASSELPGRKKVKTNEGWKVPPASLTVAVVHNTIDRLTNCTGEGQFAPYLQEQRWLNSDVELEVTVVLDESRFTPEELVGAFQYIGNSGFGCDASIGLGKFELTGSPVEVVGCRASRRFLALASSVFGGMPGMVSEETYYRVRTHFGRHGAELALSGAPFKQPVLMAQSGAVVTFDQPVTTTFVGRGITGISRIQPEAVHQGYAPVLPLPDWKETP